MGSMEDAGKAFMKASDNVKDRKSKEYKLVMDAVNGNIKFMFGRNNLCINDIG